MDNTCGKRPHTRFLINSAVISVGYMPRYGIAKLLSYLVLVDVASFPKWLYKYIFYLQQCMNLNCSTFFVAHLFNFSYSVVVSACDFSLHFSDDKGY